MKIVLCMNWHICCKREARHDFYISGFPKEFKMSRSHKDMNVMKDKKDFINRFGKAQESRIRSEIDYIEALTPDEVQSHLRQLGMQPTKILPQQLRQSLVVSSSEGHFANVMLVLASVKEHVRLFFLAPLANKFQPLIETRWRMRLLSIACLLIGLFLLTGQARFGIVSSNNIRLNKPIEVQIQSNKTGSTPRPTAEESDHIISETMERDGAKWQHGNTGIDIKPEGRAHLQSVALSDTGMAGCGTISDCAYQTLHNRVAANRDNFYVYRDADSAFNHGFPSGLFGTIDFKKVVLDASCVDDPASPTGCSADPARLDTTRGTVFRFNYPALTGDDFVGLNWQDPEKYDAQQPSGSGYDLTPATSVQLDARSPDGAKVQFGVGGCVTNFYQLGPAWTTITISLPDLIPPPGISNVTCPVDLTNTHLLFAVSTNALMSPHGGTALLDNIQFLPVPARQSTDPRALSLPLGNQTFGAVLQKDVTPDQANRNLAPIYESAATILSLLKRGQPEDVDNALRVADALDYALHHDNHGNPLPAAADGSVGLRSAYQGGDIALLNEQSSANGAQAGDVRLAGFSVKDGSCGRTGFCLVLDGATGGNNAWAMMALLAAYLQSGNQTYLNDAETIGKWIVGTLKDPARPTTNPPSYGGYFVGFADGGTPFPIKGKSTENNGDIFVALSLVSQIENNRGNPTAAAQWQTWANVAGDFVMQMFDPATGRFYAGTVTDDPPSPPNPIRGNCQVPFMQKGNDIINTCDFLDSNTFTTLPMAASPQYRNQIDWRHPIQYTLNHFAQTITAGGHTYSGYDIVMNPSSGPNGIAWEFTGQTVVAERFIDALYNQTIFESSADFTLDQIKQAQASAPFGDGLGLPASTLQDGDRLPPLKQCLDTPFQCIPERVGLAATNWAIYADQAFNPLWFGNLSFSPLTPPFPQQLVGTTSPASKVLVTNTAAAAVTLSELSITGPHSNDFAVSDNCPSSTLMAGATCTITITFTPSAAGDRTATLLIKDTALGSPQAIALKGVGLPLNDFSLQVSPNMQSTVAGNKAIYTIQTQVTRGSAQPIALSVSCLGLSCSLAPANITSGGSATLTVSTDVSTSPQSYAITVSGTGPEVTHTASTNLSVTAAASLSPTSLIYATQQTGTTSASQTVTLKNNSPSSLSISAISIGGAFSADFAQTSNCGSTLSAGASCTLNVTFTPTGVDGRKATLFVFDNAGGAPQTVELSGAGVGSCFSISDCGFRLLNQRASENQNGFYVYKDADSGLNHGFPSGLFGSYWFDLTRVKLDAACIDDLLEPTGCTADLKRLDAARGTVFRITFPSLTYGQFVGLNFQDPQDYAPPSISGNGYDLSPANAVQFDVRSPDGIKAQFGVGPCVSDVFRLNPSWKTLTIPFNTLKQPQSPTNTCDPNITNTHLLFTVVTNVDNAPAGGTVLLDNIQFLPVPVRQRTDSQALSLPVDTQTVGVVANQRLPIPTDQVNRNLATISSSGQTVLALLQRQQPGDVANALKMADAFDYALYHDNHGDPIPTAPQLSNGCYSGSPAQQCGLHSAYINGDIAFLNNQPAPALGQAGDVRLAGFSSGMALCGPSGFCLVLDGASGGDNAWAMMALIAAYKQSGRTQYLDDAVAIGNWIFANLADSKGYGGYFVGYNDGGLPKRLILGKATSQNAQIFVAFSRLAQVEADRGNSAPAAQWTTRANAAANFVLEMFDSTTGRFYAGTVNVASARIQGPGLCPDLLLKNEDDVVNTCDSLDSDTVATLALASSYPAALDWTRPVQYALNHFPQTITADGKAFSGFNLVSPQGAVQQAGVAWEFTGQMALGMNVVDASSGTSQFANSASFYLNQIRQAQLSAPFGDGRGLVGSTLQDGDTLPPYRQCLSTPFQCIPERVELATTAWNVFADLNINPLHAASLATPATVQFSATSYTVNEGAGSSSITVTRSGDTSSALTVDYETSDGTAQQRTDYTLSAGTLSFAAGETNKSFAILITDDAYVEGNETLNISLSNPTGGVALGLPGTAVLTITDNDAHQPTTNPSDDAQFFVRQQYADFLNRAPDAGGLGYWTKEITKCGSDAQCIHDRRVGVADAFFFEPEFQQTGAYIYRLYKAAFGSRPTYAQFTFDRGRVLAGTGLDQSKSAFALTFVGRGAFLALFPRSLTAEQFLDALLASIRQNSGVDLSAQRSALMSLYDGMDTGRAAILRQVADNSTFSDAEYNRAFVLTQYFGYLRRDPDEGGYQFWLRQVNKYPIRNLAIQHAMVCSFITSREYQERFSSVVMHGNAECPQ